MVHIHHPREIIDRRQLAEELDAAASGQREDTKRTLLITKLKAAHIAGTGAIRERFEKNRDSGVETVAAHSYLMDQLIRVLYDFAVTHILARGVPTKGERISIVAIGGYGRGELAPLSGTANFNKGLAIGYFAQHQVEMLRNDESPLWNLA